MKKLDITDTGQILEHAGGVLADNRFQGTPFTTPVRKPESRDLHIRELQYNEQHASLRAPIERTIANLKT